MPPLISFSFALEILLHVKWADFWNTNSNLVGAEIVAKSAFEISEKHPMLVEGDCNISLTTLSTGSNILHMFQ